MNVSASALLDLKIHCLSNGIRMDDDVAELLSSGGEKPLTIHEYATTGGVTLRMGDIYLNAPFDDWYCSRSEAILTLDDGDGVAVRYRGVTTPAEVLPLPEYIGAMNADGQPVTRTVMSHCDRVRVSPISGCTLDCKFCDLPALRYTRHSVGEMLASIEVAKTDHGLPPQHLLISGGSPGPAHFDWYDDTLVELIARSGLQTDVMMSPREGSLDFIKRYADAGVWGFSLNLEVFGEGPAMQIMPRKHRRSTPHVPRTVEAALDAVGGEGRVRSIVIVGLESIEVTLEAVEFIARMGADPVLSPFRPAQNTALEAWEPPSEEYLRVMLREATSIAQAHGVRLGPRCIPCQHNTLVLPDDSGDYWYSGAND